MDWKPIKVKPNESKRDLAVLRAFGNETEFENPRGLRYLRVRNNDVEKWFSLHSNHKRKRATRARVQLCCRRLQATFGKFIDRSRFSKRLKQGYGPVCIFERNGSGYPRAAQIHFCPFCGKKIMFSEEEAPQVRAAAATNQDSFP